MKTKLLKLLIVLPAVPPLLAVAPGPSFRPGPPDPAALYERPIAVAPPKTQQAFPELKQGPGGYWLVDFSHLASFPYEAPKTEAPPKVDPTPTEPLPSPDQLLSDAAQKAAATNVIPREVLALEGRRVSIFGYMLPVTLDEKGFVKEFLIIRSPMVCCYGAVPGPNEWVVVKMMPKSQKVAPMMDVPLNFYGTLHVGEIFEGGMFAGLYRLDGEKVAVGRLP